MKVVIVGGGTAGWLSALFFSKIFPNTHTITLIESSSIGIIGVGEGSTGLLHGVINNQIANFGCNELDFLKETNSTLKLGIRYNDWTQPGSTYVQPIDGSYTAQNIPDSHFLYGVLKDGKYKNKIHTMTPLGFLLEEKKSTFFKDGTGSLGLHAYHFDSHLVGKYFKKLSIGSGVAHIDDEVVDVNLTNEGFIKSLNLASGKIIEGDFFIDASGFKKVLIEKMGSKWISYKKYLPVNTALPFQIKYKENEEIEPSTLAVAQKFGWRWRIPVKDRYGSGYVFCDDFINREQAQAEIEQQIGHEIDPVRSIKFESGCLDKFWNKNCLAIGLSSAFLEPLEATSIHTTLMQLWVFIKEFSRPTLDDTYCQANETLYNRRISRVFEDVRDFLILHYKTKRTDTEFWKYMNSDEVNTDFTRQIIEICKLRSPTASDFNQYTGSLDWTLWSHILAGTGNFTADVAKKDLMWYNQFNTGMNSHNMHEFQHASLLSNLLSNTEFIRTIFNDSKH
jgi:hypothetical protein